MVLIDRNLKQGQSALLTLVVFVVIILFLAVALEWARIYQTRQELQHWVESAALAAAQDLSEGTSNAKDKATDFYARNLAQKLGVKQEDVKVKTVTTTGNTTHYEIGSDESGYDEVAVTTPYASPAALGSGITAARAVEVGASRDVNLLFSGLLLTEKIRVSARAVAGESAGPEALVVLNRTASRSLTLGGSGNISITSGGAIVNSSASDALRATGSVNFSAQRIRVNGGVSVAGTSATITPTPLTGEPPVSDPLAHIPPPSTSGLPTFPAVNVTTGTHTLSPGVYTGGITIGGNASVTLLPGIYILNGGGLQVSGTASISGTGVTIYNTGGGTIKLVGTGSVILSPPTSGTYQGIIFFQDRANTNTARFTGTSSAGALAGGLQGTFYFPAAKVELSGNGNISNTQFISDTLDIQGTGNLNINFDPTRVAAGAQAVLLE